MDKLRALQYFIASAKSGSFSRAARQFAVTVPAVQKLVGQLERELGVRLLTRSPQGLTLTGAGGRYLFDVESSLADLDRADTKIRPRDGGLNGTVVVGASAYLVAAIFEPVYDDFAKRFPALTLEFRSFDASTSTAHAGIDVHVSQGWYSPQDLVERTLLLPKFVTVATPAFWQRHGKPRHPNDLRNLPCVMLRTFAGTLMDLWDYERDNEVVRVPVKGTANFDNALREAMFRLVLRGYAASRSIDFLMQPQIDSGELEMVLTDWSALGAPPLCMHYRNDARSDPSVAAVIDFIAEQFDTAKVGRKRLPPPPDWTERKLPRASLHVNKSKKAETSK